MIKKRMFYLDFIRVICMILVLVYHYIGGLNNWIPLDVKLPISFGESITFGELAVVVFFMISGSSLYYNYKDKKIDLKEYYRKRVKSIIPLFWITWLFAFLFNFFFISYNIDPTIQWWTLIFSVLGIDQYIGALFGIKTFALVSEWFLGCIMIYYLIFPFLMNFFKRNTWLLFIISLACYTLALFFPLPNLNTEFNPVIHLMEFIMGMYLMKYINIIAEKKYFLFISIFVILLGYNGLLDSLVIRLKYMLVGLSFYIIMAFISNFIRSDKIKNCFSKISQYTYAIFLNHHFILTIVLLRYQYHRPDLINGFDSIRNVICLTLITIMLIIYVSYYIIKIEKKVTNRIFK